MQIKFNRGEINAFVIFCLFPWLGLIAPALLAYPLLVGLLLINRAIYPLLAIIVSLSVASGLVFFLSVSDQLKDVHLYNTYNTTFGWLIIFIVLLVKPQFPIKLNKLIDLSVIAFLVVSLALITLFYFQYKAIVQIMGLTFAMYFIYTDKAYQKIVVIGYLLASGGRANTLALLVAWIWVRWKHLRAMLSWPAFVGLLIVVSSGAAFTFSSDYLVGLREQGILLKGRTNFWIALLADSPGIFGHGAGASLLVIEHVNGKFQLPHNDWLRIFYDFGYAGLLATIAVMFFVMRKEGPARFATVVLAISMVFDNTLSYPTAIAAYFMVCLSHAPARATRSSAEKLLRPKTIRQLAGTELPPKLGH